MCQVGQKHADLAHQLISISLLSKFCILAACQVGRKYTDLARHGRTSGIILGQDFSQQLTEQNDSITDFLL